MVDQTQDQIKNSSTMIATETQTSQNTENIAWTIAQAADERKAEDIVILEVAEVSYLTEYFVIVTGFSQAQIRAIALSIKEKVEQEWQKLPLRVDGLSSGSWVVQDYGDVIVHILLPNEREYYNLEAFWGHAKRIDVLEQTSGEE